MCYGAAILAVPRVWRRDRAVEHPLLNAPPMRPTTRPALFALALLAALASPGTVHANITPPATVGSFGTGNHMSVNPDLVMYPIGADECMNDPIPITFSGLNSGTIMHYIDVWSATSPSVPCATGGAAGRGNTTTAVCTHVSLPTSVNGYIGGPTFTMNVTANDLFGGCTMSNTLTFFFFDVTSVGDNSTTFAPNTYATLTITLNTTPPGAPTITSTPAGDSVLQIEWSIANMSSLGVAGRVRLYKVGTGCAGGGTDGGGGIDSGMDAAVPVDMGDIDMFVADDAVSVGNDAAVFLGDAGMSLADYPASSPVTVPTSVLGWTSGVYGDSALIAIAVVDSSGNVSQPSNTVCAEHVPVTGFWYDYCRSHNLLLPDGGVSPACAQYYSGCSCAVPRRRGDASATVVLAGVAAVFVLRRRRR